MPWWSLLIKTKYQQQSFFSQFFEVVYNLVYTKKVDIVYCQSDLLLKLGISSAIHLQANYKPNSHKLWQNGFSVWYRNKWRSLKNIQGSCSQQYIHVKGDKIRFGRFTGKAFNCQFNLNVLMKLLKTFYVYKCKYRKSCNTLFSWHVHK